MKWGFKRKMSLYRISFLVIIFSCCSCSNFLTPDQKTSRNHEDSQELKFLSEINQIKKDFDTGTTQKACSLYEKLIKNPYFYGQISSEMKESLQGFENKCGKKVFLITTP